MSFEQEWAANEDQLVREAGSLGELLARMKGLFSSLSINDKVWEGLVTQAHELPPTLAGFPLWVGLPIGQSRPTAALNVSLVSGTRSAAFFENTGQPNESEPPTACVASLLRAIGREASPLGRIVGDRMLLQYEIDPLQPEQEQPGFCLYPVRRALAGDPSGQQIGDFQIALDAVISSMNREPDEIERLHAERIYRALEPDTRIGTLGVLPSKEELFQLSVPGFVKARDVMDFLNRIGWPGQRSVVATVLDCLEARDALAGMQLGVQPVISAAGLDSSLELHIFSANTIYDDTGWFKDKTCWTELMDALAQENLALPEKLAGLAEWTSGAKPLIGRSGPLLLLQRIHHFSIVLSKDGVEQVNVYLFLLMARWSRQQ